MLGLWQQTSKPNIPHVWVIEMKCKQWRRNSTVVLSRSTAQHCVAGLVGIFPTKSLQNSNQDWEPGRRHYTIYNILLPPKACQETYWQRKPLFKMEKNAPLLKQIRAAFFVKYIPLMLKAQQYISSVVTSNLHETTFF